MNYLKHEVYMIKNFMSLQDVVEIVSSLHNRLLILEASALKPVGSSRLGILLSGEMGDIVVDDGTNTLLKNNSDDGFIVKMHSTDHSEAYVIKVYKQPENVNGPLREKYVAVAKDQVAREFKSLSLLKGHPNVPRLLSDEIDTGTLHIDDGKKLKSFILKTEYLPNLKNFYSSPFSRLEMMLDSDGSVFVDFAHMRRLVDYVFGQAASLMHFLQRYGIEHRDVDVENFLIQTNSLRIVLMDFARAKIPHVDGLPDTEDPDEIVKRCDSIMSSSRSSDEEYDLANYTKKRYKNENNNIAREVQGGGVMRDTILAYYWISHSITRYCTIELRSKYEEEEAEIAALRLITKQFKDVFENDLRPILHYAVPPTEDLAKYLKVYEMGSTKDGNTKLRRSRPTRVVHSADYEEIKEKIRRGTLGSVEIEWD
jgi:serine/threonine protein kinase